MTRFNDDGATLIISHNGLSEKSVAQLESLLLEVPDVVELAVEACAAPRHATTPAARQNRDEDKMLRRKWFGQERGTVRHTFRDIKRFLDDNAKTLTIVVGGDKCIPGAWAYTPDNQVLGGMPRVHICPIKFFAGDATTQLATIVHELTHLVRDTADFTREIDFEDLGVVEAFDTEIEKQKNKNYFQQGVGDEKSHISSHNAAKSAYNYQHFTEDLIAEQYGIGILTAARLEQ